MFYILEVGPCRELLMVSVDIFHMTVGKFYSSSLDRTCRSVRLPLGHNTVPWVLNLALKYAAWRYIIIKRLRVNLAFFASGSFTKPHMAGNVPITIFKREYYTQHTEAQCHEAKDVNQDSPQAAWPQRYIFQSSVLPQASFI